MNFDGMFFSRIDYQDQDFRREQRTLEHVWHGSEDLGADSDIFASVINHGYAPPDKFNWDLLDGRDEPIIDNVASEEYNLDQRVEQFVEAAILYQSNYRTNHIMFPMGEDFEYQAAHVWFKNMDKLIAGVNAKHSRVNVLYSTPSCYLKALNESGTLFTDKSDDFLPYSSNVDSVWSGYFTSRPTLKRLDKVANNWLQACKQIDVLAGNPHNRYAKQIGKLKESVAVFQHHDAVVGKLSSVICIQTYYLTCTHQGTEKQHVANDYVKQLQAGIDQCREVISASLGKLISGSNSAPKYMYCDYLNISSCSATEKNNHLGLQLYNPFSHRVVNHTVRIPVDYTLGQYVEVTDARGGRVPATIFAIPEWIRKVPGREGNASEEVVFDVSIEPLSYNTYFVKYVSQPNDNVAVVAARWDINQNITVSIGKRQFTFDSDGRLTTTSIDAKSVIHFEHDFYYYEGATGDNKLFHRSSGAYVFKPKASAPKLVGKLIETSLYVDDDRNLYEIHQKYDTFVAQVIRLHPHKEFIEFNWFVDSIPISDNVGKEVIVRYRATNMNTHSTFTTDSNGRQMIERVWNYRPSWNYTSYQLMPGNYYPANSRVYVQDKAANVQFTVMTDRTQGCTSPGNGSIELMLHRRLLHDDSFGVGEALNETGPNGEGLKVTGTHYLLFDSIKDSTRKHRTFGQQLYLFPLISFVPINSNAERQRLLKFAAQTTLAAALPENVNILTLEQWDERQILLRLEHFYQSNEDVELSKPAKVDLTRLFANIKINTARELTLGANQDIAARGDRLSFRYKSSNSLPKATAEGVLDPKEVTLNPMQIRTFLVSY